MQLLGRWHGRVGSCWRMSLRRWVLKHRVGSHLRSELRRLDGLTLRDGERRSRLRDGAREVLLLLLRLMQLLWGLRLGALGQLRLQPGRQSTL